MTLRNYGLEIANTSILRDITLPYIPRSFASVEQKFLWEPKAAVRITATQETSASLVFLYACFSTGTDIEDIRISSCELT